MCKLEHARWLCEYRAHGLLQGAGSCARLCAVNDDELFERIMPRDLKIWEEGGVPDPDHACSLIR